MSTPITVERDARPEPKLDATPWTRIEGTQPRTVTLVNYQSTDGRKIAGTWTCTPGKWSFAYDKWEYCHLHEGHCIVTPEGQAPVHLRAGDVFTIEPGTRGTWEVLQTVRKHFVFVS